MSLCSTHRISRLHFQWQMFGFHYQMRWRLPGFTIWWILISCPLCPKAVRKWSSVLVTRGSNQAFNPASGMPEPVAREESWEPRIRALKLEGLGAGLLSKKTLSVAPCEWYLWLESWHFSLHFLGQSLWPLDPVLIMWDLHHCCIIHQKWPWISELLYCPGIWLSQFCHL